MLNPARIETLRFEIEARKERRERGEVSAVDTELADAALADVLEEFESLVNTFEAADAQVANLLSEIEELRDALLGTVRVLEGSRITGESVRYAQNVLQKGSGFASLPRI